MAETIYNSIHTGQQIDAAVSWLQIHAADQICGGAVSGTTIETPDYPTYWFAPQGTYTCGNETVTIASGNLGIISYDGTQWSSISFFIGGSLSESYVAISSVNDLPSSPTDEQKRKGYIMNSTLYVWVGTNGDTLSGKYQSINVGGVGFESIATPSPSDGTAIITLTNGDTITLDLNHDHEAYPKYELVSSLPASPDSGTLYLIAAT